MFRKLGIKIKSSNMFAQEKFIHTKTTNHNLNVSQQQFISINTNLIKNKKLEC